jgi:hypothetical protein
MSDPIVAPHDLGQLFVAWLEGGRPPDLGEAIKTRLAVKYRGLVVTYGKYRFWLEERETKTRLLFDCEGGSDK